jgi:uncharacterized membrane-anchored protein YhcB (DUF1043 family)
MEQTLGLFLLWLMGSLVVGVMLGYIFRKMNNSDQ